MHDRKEDRKEARKEDRKVDTTNVFIKFLPSDVNDGDLHKLFEPFGKIVSAKVIVNPHTWESLGYGFVKYELEGEARKAVQKMSGYKLKNKAFLCKLSDEFAIPEPSANVYVKPLPSSLNELELTNMFDIYGPIDSVKIVHSPDKPDDVIGLIRYKNIESAQKAIHSMHGQSLLPNWQALQVKFAESETQRSSRKANRPSPPKYELETAAKIIAKASMCHCAHPEPPPPPPPQSTMCYFHYYLMPSPQQSNAYFNMPVMPVMQENAGSSGWYNYQDNKYYPGYVTN